MPNWCHNTITIKGTPEQLSEFSKKYLQNDEFSFESVIPSPKTVDDCPDEYVIHNESEAAKYFLKWDPSNPTNWFNWFNWNCYNWGCKWDASYPEIYRYKNSIKIEFDTPWGPPSNVIERLVSDNPDIKIKHKYSGNLW